MRESKFRVYLDRRYENQDTAAMYVRDMRAAERRLGSDIEAYLAEDPARPLPNHCKSADRVAANRYREFLRDHDINKEGNCSPDLGSRMTNS